jgi:nucleoid DNA-binding protein
MANVKQPSTIKINEIAEVIRGELIKYGKVKVIGLGIFSLKVMKQRDGFNPGTNKRQSFPPYIKLTFIPTKKFKEQIKLWKK